MKWLYGAIFAAWLASLWFTHSWSVDHGAELQRKADAKELSQAKQERDDAQIARDAAIHTTTQLQVKFDRLTNAMKAQASMFDAVMANRNELQDQLDKLSHQHQAEVIRTAHETPNCTDLARLPVCPAVAERLWPSATGQPVQATRDR